MTDDGLPASGNGHRPDPARRPLGAARGPVRAWWLVATAIAVGVLTFLIVGLSPPPSVESIGDETFIREANSLCLAARRQLDELPQSQPADPPTERAANIRRRARVLDEMVGGLRRLRPVPSDRSAVNRWLDEWALVVRTGYRVADALAVGAVDEVEEIVSAGRAADRYTDAFAAVNGMGDCVI